MFGYIVKYKKLRDYININTAEVKISLLIATVILLIFNMLNVYSNYDVYESTIETIMTCVIGGFIGLIGFSLSGLSILTTMFSRKQIEFLEKNNPEHKIEEVLCSYAFNAFSIAIAVIVLIMFMLISKNNEILVSKATFNVCCWLLVYIIVFNIMYTVALTFNCIECFAIKNILSVHERKDFFDKVNEVRIDYLIRKTADRDLTPEKLIKDLEEAASTLNKEDKEKIMEYFKKYYKEG